jgi:hypothetical protein
VTNAHRELKARDHYGKMSVGVRDLEKVVRGAMIQDWLVWQAIVTTGMNCRIVGHRSNLHELTFDGVLMHASIVDSSSDL